MGLKELRAEIEDEVSILFDSDFVIDVTNTERVPHASDPAITFPDVTARTQGTKLIETCVLYIDIRRSTELNFSHRPRMVAKLYTAFVRAMTRVARYYNGHVRGIIGDRVMVIFDRKNCFKNAVNCAIAMNTVSQHIINKHFKANEVTCGIGIDAGPMLATKTGVRRHGVEQTNYRSLVWLGRPANTASKLTDLANKPAETEQVKMVDVAYNKPVWDYPPRTLAALGSVYAPATVVGLGSAFGKPTTLEGIGSVFANLFERTHLARPSTEWEWKAQTLDNFLSNVSVEYVPSRLVHNDPSFGSFYLMDQTRVVREGTPPILMTARVWNGFRSECPNDDIIKKGWIKRVPVKTPAYTEDVFGGDVFFRA